MTAKKKKKAKPSKSTVTLDVCLHETANPPVFVSERNKPAAGGSKLQWSRSGGAKKFDFVDFEPKTAPFDAIDIKDNKVECTFNPPTGLPDGTTFPYTLTVKRHGKHYTSTQVTPDPTEGQPVIRKSIGP